MKKILSISALSAICLMLLGASINTANAQSWQSSPLTWGPKAGVTISDMYGDDVGGTTVRAGFTGGLFLNYRINPFVSIQPEALFTMKYSKASVLGETKTEYDLGYLEIPVLFKGHLPTTGMISPNLYAGPSLAFKLYGEADGDDLKGAHESIDFGIVFGGGIDIMSRLNLDLRYTLGLTNVFDVPAYPSAKNGSFQITVGVSI